jgi:hypothetical protein
MGERKETLAYAKPAASIPESRRDNINALSHRVFVDRAEIGAVWSKGCGAAAVIWIQQSREPLHDQPSNADRRLSRHSAQTSCEQAKPTAMPARYRAGQTVQCASKQLPPLQSR